MGLIDGLISPISSDAGSSFTDGQLINGVANFVRTTKPTVRTNGSALVSGDRWYKTDSGITAYWNGTYWLSQQRYGVSGNSSSASATSTDGRGLPVDTLATGIFVHTIKWGIEFVSGTIDSSNFWTIGVERVASVSNVTSIFSYQLPALTVVTGELYVGKSELNLYIPLMATGLPSASSGVTNIDNIRFSWTRTLTPPNLRSASVARTQINYSMVY